MTPQASLISPAPFLAPGPFDASPVPNSAEWADSAAKGTRLRHRSARSEGPHAGWVIGGAVAILVGVAALFLVTGGELDGYWSKVRNLVPSPRNVLPSRVAAEKTKAGATAMPGLIELPSDTISSGPDSPPPLEQPSSPGDQPSSPATASIRLTKPLPEGSRVTVDTNLVKPSPDGLLTVEPGSHVIRVRAPGYRSARRTLRGIAAGDTAHLDLVLLPLPLSAADANQIDTLTGAIVVQGDLPPGSVVRIDGRVTAPGSRVLTVSAGSHWVALSAPGYQTDSTRIYLEQGSWSDWLVPKLTALTDSAATADSVLPVPPELPSAAATGKDSLPEPR